jgi:cell division protein FtsL
MKHPINLCCVLLLGLMIVGLFAIKHNVQNLNRDLSEINRELSANQSSIHVLNAEWAYLNEPARIKKLSDKYLTGMNYTTVAQLKNKNDIKTIYLASREPVATPDAPMKPTLKPILSSARGYR